MTFSLPKILITGGNGQLASAIKNHPLANEFQLILCDRSMMDITDKNAIAKAIENHNPDIIINTAAYTAVDKAEQEKDLAIQINHLGAQNLSEACQMRNIPLLHVSTDYIFDGAKQTPYLENDVNHPINFYGQSKWLGEQAVRETCDKHIILRVSGVFSEYGHNFLKTIVRLAKERKELRIVADQVTCPTYAGDIAGALLMIAKKPSHWGTYHYCSEGAVSWHQFASEIVEATKSQYTLPIEEIKAITTAEFPTAAKRPAYSVLDCTKLNTVFNIKQPLRTKHLAQAIKGMPA